MDSLVTGKVGALFALIALTLIFGVIPFFLVLRRSRSLVSIQRQAQVIQYLNSFAAGVFLSALLLHLMVEGSEEFDEFKEEAGFDSDFPLFNTFVAAGFFAVAFIEYLMHKFLLHGSSHAHSVGVCRTSETKPLTVGGGPSSPPAYGALEKNATGASVKTFEDETITNKLCSNVDVPTTGTKVNEDVAVIQTHDNCATSYSHMAEASPLRAFLLFSAVSFHTIFDGLAVGLQTTTSALWEMFVAISIHKSIMAFCLGIEIFSKYLERPQKAVLWICLFSLMSPIGILIGIFVTSGGVDDEARHLSSGILQGVASGTFMYVTFLEILNHAWQHKGQRHLLDILFAMIGFGCMAVVKYLDKD